MDPSEQQPRPDGEAEAPRQAGEESEARRSPRQADENDVFAQLGEDPGALQIDLDDV